MLPLKGFTVLCYATVFSFGVACIQHQKQDSLFCYIKSSKWGASEIHSCQVRSISQGCMEHKEMEHNNVSEEIKIFEVEHKFNSSIFNFSVPLEKSGTVQLVISHVNPYRDDLPEDSKTYKQISDAFQCIQIRFDDVSANSKETVSLHVDGLEFQNGDYDVTVVISQNTTDNDGYEHLMTSVIGWKRFSVRSETKIFEKTEVSQRREVLKDLESCSCCIVTSHNYVQKSELLEFFYVFPGGPCHKDFHVQLYSTSDPSVDTEEECLGQNDRGRKMIAITKIAGVGGPRRGAGNATETVTVSYPSTPGGCYIFRTVRGHYHTFIWLQSLFLEPWNTTITIVPDESRRSLDVWWHQPDFPFNFTTWKVKLLFLEENTLDCGLHNNTSVYTNSTFEQDLNETSHTFKNLSDGFYCVWLNSGEGRFRDGPWRTSTTVHLDSKTKDATDDESSNYMWIVLVVGATTLCAVIVLVILLFFKLFYLKRHRSGSYSSVTQLDSPLETIPVLLIWTKLFEERKEEFKKVVQVFKELLRTYAKCEVYDYMDYASLNTKEKQKLMMDPVKWLQKHFQNSREKIIFVESPGVPIKPRNGEILSEKIPQQSLQGVDEIDYKLFPHALRYLKDSVELSSDYSKVFYVRFQGLHSQNTDVPDIVPLMRYTIPDHMRKLALNLRGFDKDSCFSLQPLPDRLVKEFQFLINALKTNTNSSISNN